MPKASRGKRSEQPGLPPDEKKHKQLTYQRKSIACKHCRHRKIRCDGGSEESANRCVNCEKLSIECIFTPVTPTTTTMPMDARRSPRRVGSRSQGTSVSTSTPPTSGLTFASNNTSEIFAPGETHSPRTNGRQPPPEQYSRQESYASLQPSTMDTHHLQNAYALGASTTPHHTIPDMIPPMVQAPVYATHHEQFGTIQQFGLPLTTAPQSYPHVNTGLVHNSTYTWAQDDTRWGEPLPRAQTFADMESSRQAYPSTQYYQPDGMTRRSSTMSVMQRPPSSLYDRGSSTTTASRSPLLPTSMGEHQLMVHSYPSAHWPPHMDQDFQQRPRQPTHDLGQPYELLQHPLEHPSNQYLDHAQYPPRTHTQYPHEQHYF